MRKTNSNPVQRACYLLTFMVREYYAWGEIGEMVPPMKQREAATVLNCSVPTAVDAIRVLEGWKFLSVQWDGGVLLYELTPKALTWFFSHEDYCLQMSRMHAITMKPTQAEVDEMQRALLDE